MRKKLKFGFVTVLVVFISWMLFGVIMTFGHKSMPEVEVPIELKELKKKFDYETKGGYVSFNRIQKHEMDECHFNIELNIYMNDDCILKSKKVLDNYINSVNKRVNERLKNKSCIDSLVIFISAHKTKFSKSNHFRYSFPINISNN